MTADSASAGSPQEPVPLEDFVIITGVSGAGRSTAMEAFEDSGYFCVDNLPPEMIAGLVDLFLHEGSKVRRAAVVSDARGGAYFEQMSNVLDDLAKANINYRVLFLDADDQELLTRYQETRRRHPLSPQGSVPEGVQAERALVAGLRQRADLVIDSTGLKASDLRAKLIDELLPRSGAAKLAVTFESFGFKHGPARDADLLFDVRFLPNPHYIDELRPLTGRDPEIVEYIGEDGRLEQLYERLMALLDFLLPQYIAEGKSHLTVAVGCTGGHHRSVAVAEGLAHRYSDFDGLAVDVAHRDIEL